MYDSYYPPYHHYDLYHTRKHNGSNNGFSHQENFQSPNKMLPMPSPDNFANNSLAYPPVKTPAYHSNQMQPIPYHIQSVSDLEQYLKYLSYQLSYLIQQNRQLLQHLQKQKLPEQSQTVSTPSGGTVIVRM